MRMLFRALVALLALVGASALAVGLWFMSGGINSKQQPGQTETTVARKLRSMAIPDRARNTQNPVRVTPAVLETGRPHFRHHCASCHGNGGAADPDLERRRC